MAARPEQAYLHPGKGDHRDPLAEEGGHDQLQLRMTDPGDGPAELVVLGRDQPRQGGH